MLFAAVGKFGARPPRNNHGMSVLCQIPCVVEHARLAQKSRGCGKSGRVLGRNLPRCRTLVTLPTGPVWPALMWTISGEVEVARVAASGKRWCAL